MMTTLETCEFIAKIAHKGQVDKSGADELGFSPFNFFVTCVSFV